MRFFLWVFTLIAAIVAAVYFSDLNPDPIMLRLSRQTSTAVTSLYLVLFCIAGGPMAAAPRVAPRPDPALRLHSASPPSRPAADKRPTRYSRDARTSPSPPA